MKLLDVVFYHFYCFYRRRFHDITPETSTITSIWVFLFGGVMTFISGFVAPFGKTITIIACFAVGVGGIAILQAYFIKSGRWKRILKEKPVIKSKRFSIIITIAFAVLGILLAFGGLFLAKYIRTGSV